MLPEFEPCLDEVAEHGADPLASLDNVPALMSCMDRRASQLEGQAADGSLSPTLVNAVYSHAQPSGEQGAGAPSWDGLRRGSVHSEAVHTKEDSDLLFSRGWQCT